MSEEKSVPTITINDKQYPLENLSDRAKSLIRQLRITDAEIRHQQSRIAIAQTARHAYGLELKAELDKIDAPAA